MLQFFLTVVIQEAQWTTRFLSTALTGQESTSDTSVIRDILCLVLQSEGACPAVNGAEIEYSVRILYKTELFWTRCHLVQIRLRLQSDVLSPNLQYVARVCQRKNGRYICNSSKTVCLNRILVNVVIFFSSRKQSRRTELDTSSTDHGTQVMAALEKPCDPPFGVKLHFILKRNKGHFHWDTRS